MMRKEPTRVDVLRQREGKGRSKDSTEQLLRELLPIMRSRMIGGNCLLAEMQLIQRAQKTGVKLTSGSGGSAAAPTGSARGCGRRPPPHRAAAALRWCSRPPNAARRHSSALQPLLFCPHYGVSMYIVSITRSQAALMENSGHHHFRHICYLHLLSYRFLFSADC